MEKWKKAVVHLECATDSEQFQDQRKRIDNLFQKLRDGDISKEDFLDQISGKTRDIRFHGSAIFLKHNKRRYLITARHVLWDEYSAKVKYQEEPFQTIGNAGQLEPVLQDYFTHMINDTIFNIIFRVPSFDEILQDSFNRDQSFLMNLGAGTSFTVPYSFSKPEIDLAVISLDQRDSRFADNLIRIGKEPITCDDIGEEPSGESAEVFAVGYPSSTALLGYINQHADLAHWSSSYFSLPTFSFGRVSMIHDELPFFWADMSIYPGNSGGPIIEGDKLVGIVSGQPTIPVEDSEKFRTRIPFGKIIKAKFITDLLLVQEQKDSNSL
jgi:hypothetical protein